jgi:hypothetical protein
MPSTAFRVVETLDIRGRGVVLVGDKTLHGLPEFSHCSVEITTPNGAALRDIAYKEWIHLRSTSHPEETEALFIKKKTSFDIPVGSLVRVSLP